MSAGYPPSSTAGEYGTAHGGAPACINFFESVGLYYVSCSPYRLPLARLAAAQAALQKAEETGTD